MDIYEKINSGAFKCKIDYPRKPKKPDVLSKPVGSLTDAEIAGIINVRQDYEKALKEYEAAYKAITEENNRLEIQFWADLYEDFGVPADDKFVMQMSSLAYERGHSSGWGDVVSCFYDLMPLYELYKAK